MRAHWVNDCRANGEVRNTLPTILELEIDISHDRFLIGKWRLKMAERSTPRL